MAIDRRVERSRNALYGALARQILSRQYDEIAIGDVVADAGVGRSTFYAHFRSKEDLLARSFERVTPILAHGRLLQLRRPRVESCQATLALFRHVHEHRAILRALEGSRGHEIVLRSIEARLKSFLGGFSRAAGRDGLPRDLVLDFMGGTFLSVATWWLGRNALPSAEEVDAIYHRLVDRAVPKDFFVNDARRAAA